MKNNKSITIAISNQKGGVAKTVSTAAIGSVLADKDNSVLLVDLDGQGNLSHTFLDSIPHDTVADMLNDGIIPIVTIRKGLDIIPCNSSISTIAQAMSGPEDRLILKKMLDKVRDRYDFFLLDCPPAYNYITINAYTAADYIFVPCQTDEDCREGIMLMADACLTAAPPKTISGIFFTMYDPRPKVNREIEQEICEKYGTLVLNTRISACCKVKEARRKRMDTVSYAPKCKPAREYISLVNDILGIIKQDER